MMQLSRSSRAVFNITFKYSVYKTKGNTVFIPLAKIRHFQSNAYLKCQTKYSALYVTGDRAQTVFGVLSPYVDISKTLESIHDLEVNLKLRGMHEDLRQLMHSWKELQELQSLKNKLEEERKAIASAMKTLADKKEMGKNAEFPKLKEQGKIVRENLKALTKKVLDLEDTVVLEFLKLPNKLHHSVGHEDKTLMTFFSQPSFNFEPKGHEDLGKITKELEFSSNSPTAYYLLNRLAALELSCSEYFTSVFQSHGYLLQSNPDFSKGVVVEGSGINVSDMHKVFMLSKKDSDNTAQYLVGGGSLQGFVSYFTKQVINIPECLPQKLISIGRCYTPLFVESSGLLNCCQSTAVDSFVLFEHHPSSQEDMFSEVLMVLVQCYTQLKVHFLVKQYAAHNLEPHESAALGIMMFSPKMGIYHEVGRISVCGDYISRRLLTLLKRSNTTASFLSMIHVRVCNITRLLALLMENRQNEAGSYDIPDCIKDISYT